MCVTGCMPLRAGNEYFYELKSNYDKVESLAKKHGVSIKVIDVPIKKLVPESEIGLIRNPYYELKSEKVKKNIQKWLSNTINRLEKSKFFEFKDHIYQGGLTFSSGGVKDNIFWEVLNRSLSPDIYLIREGKTNKGLRCIEHPVLLGKSIYPRKTQLIFAFAHKDNAKGRMFGMDLPGHKGYVIPLDQISSF